MVGGERISLQMLLPVGFSKLMVRTILKRKKLLTLQSACALVPKLLRYPNWSPADDATAAKVSDWLRVKNGSDVIGGGPQKQQRCWKGRGFGGQYNFL